MHGCPAGAECLTGICLNALAGHVWALKCFTHEHPNNLCSRALFYAWERNHYMHECPMSLCLRNQGSHAGAPSQFVHEHPTDSTSAWCWARTAPFGCWGCGGACARCWPRPVPSQLWNCWKHSEHPKHPWEEHSSSNIFKKQQQLLAVGLQTWSWKKALHVQGAHPRGLASIRFIGISTFFTCLLQKYQKHHFWNEQQMLSRSSDTCLAPCDSAALPQELKRRVMAGGL